MANGSFTQTELQKLAGVTGKRLRVLDPRVKGLRAELREGGTLAFYLVRRIPGSNVARIRLGAFPDMSVEAARKRANELITRIGEGANPAAAKRAKRAEPTLRELFDHYLEHHAKPHKKTWQQDQRQFDAYLKAWKSRKLSMIAKSDVQSLHAKLGTKHGKYTANRLLALLRAMFNKADEMGFVGPNPAARIKKFKEESRDRFLQPDELPRFFASLAQEPNETLRDFFMLALFTGQRRSNVAGMQWADVDLSQAAWRIPDTKQGKVHFVPLGEPALAILRRRKDAAGENAYVLPGRHKGKPVKDPTKAWKAVLERANIAGVRIHDLRRTLGSYMAIQGASLNIIGATLGHANASTTQVYARLTSTAVAEGMGKALAFIESTAKEAKE